MSEDLKIFEQHIDSLKNPNPDKVVNLKLSCKIEKFSVLIICLSQLH